MAVKIYTDASSNLFHSILNNKGLDITVLPMSLRLGDKEYYLYDQEIDVEEMSKTFYEEMKKGAKPKTSLTSPGLFEGKALEEISKGNEVIYVCLAGGISGTYQSSILIANQINEKQGKNVVKVIDSKTAGFGEGMIAIYAYSLSRQGLGLEEVYSKTEEYLKTVRSEFTVDSIKYLANTGRVSSLTAMIADVLTIKPLLYGSDEGKIVVTSKVHGRKNALKKLAGQVIENIKDKNSLVYIAHCNSPEDAKSFEGMLREAGITNIETYFYDLVTGSHVGPGTIAVFYEGENRTIEKKSVISSILGKKN